MHRLPVLQLIDPAKARRWLTLADQYGYGIDFQHFSAEGRPVDYRYPFLTSPVDY